MTTRTEGTEGNEGEKVKKKGGVAVGGSARPAVKERDPRRRQNEAFGREPGLPSPRTITSRPPKMFNPFVEIPYHPIISGAWRVAVICESPGRGLTCDADARPVGLPFVLGSLSGIATKDAVRSSWYTGMRAPAYRPPRQVSGRGHSSRLLADCTDVM